MSRSYRLLGPWLLGIVAIGIAGCCSPGLITGLPVTSHPQGTGCPRYRN